MKKSFIVEFESNGETRWLESDERIAAHLRTVASVVGSVNTGGSKPACVVKTEAGECITHFPQKSEETKCPHCGHIFRVPGSFCVNCNNPHAKTVARAA